MARYIKILILLVLWLGYAVMAFLLFGMLDAPSWLQALGWGLFSLPFFSMTWVPLVRWSNPRPTRRRDLFLMDAAYLSVGAVSVLLVVLLVRDLTAFLLYLADKPVSLLYSLHGLGVTLGASLVLYGWGHHRARRGPKLKEVLVPITDLPRELENYSILQISDLHIGRTIQKSYVERVVRMVAEQKPQMICLTGDIVDGSVAELFDSALILKRLEAPDGIFFITGNHEYYSGASSWVQVFESFGFHCLLNRSVRVKKNGATVGVVGVNDYWAKQFGDHEPPNLKLAVKHLGECEVKIFLAHQPRLVKEADEYGFDLQLSGHTHGGQFVPWTIVTRFFSPYLKGLHRRGNGWVYVSQGTGFWGPQLRLGSTSEITVLKLVSAARLR